MKCILHYFFFRVNVAICLQGASSPDPTTVYVDLRALRNDRVTLTERGAPHSLPVMESGKLLPGMNVIIANPDTKGQCGDSHLGEVRLYLVFFECEPALLAAVQAKCLKNGGQC